MKKLLLLLILLTASGTVKAEENRYTITYEYETRLTSYYPRGYIDLFVVNEDAVIDKYIRVKEVANNEMV